MSFAQFPTAIRVGGLDFPIETDFRASVAFELLASDPDASDEDVTFGLFDLYFPEHKGQFREITAQSDAQVIFLASHVKETFKALLDFYSGGMPERKRTGGSQKRLYDFEADEPYTYASFLQAYQIDLRTAKLHWWDFKALLSALPQDTVFEKILQIRGAEIGPKLPKEEKERLRRLKQFYALPEKKPKAAQEAADRTMEILMGSGDLSELEGWKLEK